jgi:hypothetical protein
MAMVYPNIDPFSLACGHQCLRHVSRALGVVDFVLFEHRSGVIVEAKLHKCPTYAVLSILREI